MGCLSTPIRHHVDRVDRHGVLRVIVELYLIIVITVFLFFTGGERQNFLVLLARLLRYSLLLSVKDVHHILTFCLSTLVLVLLMRTAVSVRITYSVNIFLLCLQFFALLLLAIIISI